MCIAIDSTASVTDDYTLVLIYNKIIVLIARVHLMLAF